MSVRRQWILLGCATLAATCFGVFVLPFLLPPAPIQAISAANTAGFNNRVAAVAAAVISVAVLLAAWRLDLRVPLPRREDCAPMSRRFVLGWSLSFGFVMAVAAVLVYLSGQRYLNDYGYFIEQMSKAADYHRRLYTELEFPYGPLLFYPALWLRGWFGLFERPLAAAYILTLFLHEFLGMLLLAYVMQCLPIAARLRRWIFLCLAAFALYPNLGLNYTFVRFAAPLGCLVFCLRGRRPGPAIPLVFAGEILALGLSPEMGFSFACGAIAFAVLRTAVHREFGWLAVAGAPLLGAAVFLDLIGPGYLSMLQQFSGGVFNLIVEPEPHVLLLLVALVWLAPLGLVSSWRESQEDSFLLTAIFVMGLALLPAALGRADAGHVVFNELAIFLLALIPVSAWKSSKQQIWAAGMVVVMVIAQAISWGRYFLPVKSVADADLLRFGPVSLRRALLRLRTPITKGLSEQLAAEHPASGPPFDIGHLRSITGGEAVVTPLDLAPAVEETLRREGMYVPDYFSFGISILGDQTEKREIAIMNGLHWAILPKGDFSSYAESPATTQELLGFPLPYAVKRQPYVDGVLLIENLARNWQPVAEIDGYTLFHRR